MEALPSILASVPANKFPGVDHLRGDERYVGAVTTLDAYQSLIESIRADYSKRAAAAYPQDVWRVQREYAEVLDNVSRPAIDIMMMLPSPPMVLSASESGLGWLGS